MIDPAAEPIGLRQPYRRIDLAARRHPPIITQEQYDSGVIPDESLYVYDWTDFCWHLKDETK